MDKRAHTFPEGISPKLNVVTRLETELAYFDVTVQDVGHDAIEIPSTYSGVYFRFVLCFLYSDEKNP